MNRIRKSQVCENCQASFDLGKENGKRDIEEIKNNLFKMMIASLWHICPVPEPKNSQQLHSPHAYVAGYVSVVCEAIKEMSESN